MTDKISNSVLTLFLCFITIFSTILYQEYSLQKADFKLYNNYLATLEESETLNTSFLDYIFVYEEDSLINDLKTLDYKINTRLKNHEAIASYHENTIYLDSLFFRETRLRQQYIIMHEYVHHLINTEKIEVKHLYKYVKEPVYEEEDKNLRDFKNEILTDYVVYKQYFNSEINLEYFSYLDYKNLEPLENSLENKKGALKWELSLQKT